MASHYVECYKSECFQNICGTSCRLLHSPIKGHPCPFYKTDAEVTAGRRAAVERLEAIDRYDLIDEYVYNRNRNW